MHLFSFLRRPSSALLARFAQFAIVTLSVLAIFLLALVPAVRAAAQETPTQPLVLTNPAVNYPVQFDISPPLRDMATEVPSQNGLHEALPVRHPKLQELREAAQRGQHPLGDGALQTSIGPLVNASIGLNLLGVGNGFPGYSVPDAPPDVNLAVGDTQILQWVNVSYAVFDKTTGAVIAGPIAGNALWSGFGGACQTSNSGDIIAQWDKLAHRWLLSQNVFSSPYMTCVAVSTTPDAMGTYYRFAFTQPGFPDYPKWGVWPDAYYQSQNNFGPSGNSYVGAYACAYERAKMLVGDSTAKQICFQTGTFDDSLLAGDLDSAGTPPPSGQPEVFLGSIDNGTPKVFEYLFHVDFTTPSNSTFTGANGSMPVPGVASFNLSCGGFGACIPQKGVSDLLDSLGDRLMYRLAYRNFSGDHQTWLVSHSVTAGSSGGERWYEFRAPEDSTSLSVYQQGTFAPDSNYRWMGSIAMDSAQDIAFAYSVSSASLFPSISYTGRVPGDELGTMETEASIVAGSGSQTDTANRWGDYTSMALDATDDCTFWYTDEYYMVTATFDWSTRLASLKFPGCGDPPSPDFSISASPASLTIQQGNQGTSTITTTVSNGFNNAISLSASGMPSGTTVSFNPNPIAAPGSGTSTMTITVGGSTAPGTYPITVTGTGGGIQHNTTVTLAVTGPPNFTISASPASLILQQGNHGPSTITTTISGGFNSAITLSASGMPSGTTVSFNPNPIPAPGGGTSTMTITVGLSTPVGTYPITVTGNGGGIQQNTTVNLTVTAFGTWQQGFDFRNSASFVTDPPGDTYVLPTTAYPTKGSGVTYGWVNTSLVQARDRNAQLDPRLAGINFANNGSPATFYVDVPSPGTYSLSLAMGDAGYSQCYAQCQVQFLDGNTVLATVTGGPILMGYFYDATGKSWSAAAWPTSNLSQQVTLTGSRLTVVVGTNKATGDFTTIAFLGVAQVPPPNFTIAASPSSLSIQQGNQGTSTITTTISGGFNNAITLSASGAPSGTTVSFNPNPIPAPGNGNSTMTITVGSSTPTGTYPITVTGNGGGIQQNTTVMLTVTAPPNFTISASPSSLSIQQGNQGTSTITTTISGGFNNAITLSASGAPSGATVSFNPNPIPAPGNGNSTMTITVGSSTPTGTYPITVTGNGGGIQQNTTVTLTVSAAPNFTISASPSSLSIQQGNQGTSTITTTISGGFNNAITLSASGAPSGATVSFNPNPIPAPGNGNSTMTITVGSGTATGTYPITVTGNGGGIQQNTTVTLTVSAAPNFTISASPSSLSIQQGNQGTATITTTISGGFSSAVTLSTSGVPSGTTVSFNPNPIPAPGNGNSTMTITVGSSTPTGTYPITVTGNGGGIQQNTTVSLTVTALQVYDCGFNFRGTMSYVNDQPYAVPVLGEITQQNKLNGNGIPCPYFWVTSTHLGEANRSTSVDARLAGINRVNSLNTTDEFDITLPAAGSYSIGLAFGDDTGNWGGAGTGVAFQDGSNSLFSVVLSGLGTAGNFYDATGNLYTAAQWPSSNQEQSVVMSGTTLRVLLTSGSYMAPIAHIRVTAAVPNFAIAASPASLSVQRGNQGTSTITTTISGGFNGAITLSSSGVPSGTTVSFNPNPIPAPGSGSSTMTITVGSSTPTGTYPITVTGNGGGVQQNTTVTLTVTPAGGQAVDVVTYHYDVTRQGQNTLESVLAPSNVNSSGFGKVNSFSLDGKVDAQPLYASGLLPQNALFVVTEHGSAYAFNADAGTQVWKVSVLGSGETTSDDHGCSQITPEIGITSTPLIDRHQGPNGAMYLVAMSKDSGGNYHHRLHALDLKTGAELFGGPVEIQAKYPGTGDGSQNGFVVFAPGQYAQRAGLLELGGVIYIAFTSHCDFRPYTGWVMGYNASTLAQTSVIDVTPNGNEGAIWMAGTGLAGDSNGNIYFLDGNGTFDTTLNGQGFPINGDYGNAFMKLSTSGGLAVADYFNMHNTVQESNADEDLGSGGAIVLPDLMDNNGQVHHLAVGAGKDSNIYVVNRDNMGKFSPNNDNAIYQELDGVLPGGVWANPAYFNNTVYYGSVGQPLRAFPIANAMLASSPSSQSATSFGYPGTSPAVSANGTSNGIVWAVENNNPAVLHAYDATNLAHELYNSNQAGSRDQFGPGNKFITPVIVNGKVFVGTQTGVAEFGLLH